MKKAQQRLLGQYESLPPALQSAMEVLSVVYRPVSRTRSLEFVQKAGIRDIASGGITPARWKILVRHLLDKGLLHEDERKIACNSEIAEVILRTADRKGTLSRWVAAVDQLTPRRQRRGQGHYPYYLYYYDSEHLLDDFRLAVHLNRADEFTNLLSTMEHSFGTTVSVCDVFQRLFNSPFDKEWLASRSAMIRNTAIREVVTSAHENLAPADEPVSVLERFVAEEAGAGDWRRNLIVRHHLLKGDLRALGEWLPRGEAATEGTLLGWELCIRGEYEKAVEGFEAAIRLIKEETRKRDVLLDPDHAAFYVIAQLGTGDVKRIRQAHKYIDLAIRKQMAPWSLYQSLKWAADVAGGKSEPRSAMAVIESLKHLPALQRLLIYAALYWVSKAAARKALTGIKTLRRNAVSGGYPWVAAECAQLEARLLSDGQGSSRSPNGHERLGTVSVLEAMQEEQPWQRGLRGLAQMVEMVGNRSSASGSASRLTWRIASEGKARSVQAYEQKVSPAGRWSKGKAVTLKRLHSRTDLAFMTLQDERVCQAIEAEPTGQSGRFTYSLDVDGGLAQLAGHPLVFRADSPGTRVEVVRAEPELRVTTSGARVKIALVPEFPVEGWVATNAESPTRLTVTAFGPTHREILAVIGMKGLVAPAGARDEIVHAVSSVSALVTVHSDIDGGEAEAEDVVADSTPLFQLMPYEDGLRTEPLVRPFIGDGPTYSPGIGGEVVFATVGGRRTRARRNPAEEMRRHREAVASCPSLQRADWDGAGWILPDPGLCLELLDELHALGDQVSVAWPKGETMRIQHRAGASNLSLKLRKKQDWFGVEGELRLDSGLVMQLGELLELIAQSEGRFLPLRDKGFLALSGRFRQRVEELAAYLDRDSKGLRFHHSRAPAIEPLIEEAGTVDADRSWEKRLRGFREAQALDPALPSTLQAELRDYQARGFQWATRLAAWGAGACLADDMGLGKTVQALTVALARAPAGPTLVVAPTSVCSNWIDEARRFTPTLRPAQFGHGDRDKALKAAGPFDVVICSYGLLHQEADRLAAVRWEMIVLDEAQAIKNRETMRSRAAMRLTGSFRMITTGTPIENHLGELWNLFNFINPGLLGSSQSFGKKFASPIQQRSSEDARRRLKRLIQPFILRRTKTAVLDELPARTEITVRVEMSEPERTFYEAVRQRAIGSLGGLGAGDGKSHLQILAEIMRLRRACCHPRLLAPDIEIPGSKLEAFSETVAELIDNSHKALVFSQFVGHLRIVREHLDRRGISYRYLDGSTPARDRKREVDAFQAGNGDLFLISLRAGGQGLNLTAADYVLHLDPWWNPAVEDQASDRAHRIGQTRPVTVYRFVMKDTIEEKIVDLHAAKRDLADNLLEGADMSGKMSADELLALLRES